MESFLIIKDPHFAFGFQNRFRKDYEGDIRAKLEFIKNYCLQNSVDKIIFTGDVFDAQYEKKWSFKQYVKNKKILEEYFVNNGIVLYSVAGNHDFFNGKEEIKGTIYGEMVETGIIHHLSTSPYISKDIEIYGIDYSSDIEHIVGRLMEINIIPKPHNKRRAVVLHQNVTIKETPFTDLTYKFLAETFSNIDIFILGHYHVAEFESGVYIVQKPKETIFISPWNLTRVVRDYYVKMDEFDVNAIHLSIDDNNKLTLTTVPIPHKPFAQAFIPEMINFLHVSKKDQFKFFEQIKDFDMILEENTTDEEILQKLCYQASFSDEAVSMALKYLEGVGDE